MHPLRKHLISVMLPSAFFLLSHSFALADEADWVYQAADLVKRLDNIAASQASTQRQAEYTALLDKCVKFSSAPAESERASRARKLTYAWIRWQVSEKLSDTDALQKAMAEYDDAKASLPEQEKGITSLLEREDKGKVSSPGTCTVETLNKEVRVTAVDYPTATLIKKIAEAAGSKADVAPEISGVSDIGSDRLTSGRQRPDFLIEHFARCRGLLARGDTIKGYQVIVEDPLYVASLAERAKGQVESRVSSPIEGGIKTGYLIMNGVYVPPPYQVEVRSAAETCAVYINGKQAGHRFDLALPKPATEPAAPVATNAGEPLSISRKSTITTQAHKMYINLAKTKGHTEAIASVGRFLDSEKIVKSWRLDERRNDLWITFTDDWQTCAMLPRLGPNDNRAPEQSEKELTEKVRKRGSEAADKSKASIEDCLQSNGLVIVSSTGSVLVFKGAAGQGKLRVICRTLHEALRSQAQLCDQVFDMIYPETDQLAWEIFLNIRHRELMARMKADGLI